jgi:hypothetical protein
MQTKSSLAVKVDKEGGEADCRSHGSQSHPYNNSRQQVIDQSQRMLGSCAAQTKEAVENLQVLCYKLVYHDSLLLVSARLVPSLKSNPSMAPRAKQKAVQSKTDGVQASKSVPPNWPPLSPVVPAEHLSVETVLVGQILVIRNLFTSNLCKNYTSFLSSLHLTTTPGKPKRGEATRVNDRFQVDDPVFARALWEQSGLQFLVNSFEDQAVFGGKVLGLNPNIRVYRYRPGQFFDKHYDESVKLQFGQDKLNAKTSWTLLIYLTTCDGGETAFYPEVSKKGEKPPEPIVVGLETGMGLLHKHGDDCLLHEGKEVRSGEKWVLRSDLVVQR